MLSHRLFIQCFSPLLVSSDYLIPFGQGARGGITDVVSGAYLFSITNNVVDSKNDLYSPLQPATGPIKLFCHTMHIQPLFSACGLGDSFSTSHPTTHTYTLQNKIDEHTTLTCKVVFCAFYHTGHMEPSRYEVAPIPQDRSLVL